MYIKVTSYMDVRDIHVDNTKLNVCKIMCYNS